MRTRARRRSRRRPAAGAGARKALVAAARKARARAYAPYSGFHVGAAVFADGRIYSGCNVENASYGLSLCAERAAVARAVRAGARRIDGAAVASDTVPPTPPCGMCLQTFAELGTPAMPVLLAGARGAVEQTTLGELLPRAFSKRYL